MIERLDFGEHSTYNAIEASIHLGRYTLLRASVKDKRVLDAACGEGYGAALLKKWGAKSVDAIDIDKETLEKATALFGEKGVQFRCHTCEELPFEDDSFDVVCSFETIEHIDDPEAFLREIKRVLKPGGTAVISCPNDPYYSQCGMPENVFHKKKYTFFDFQKLTESILGKATQYLLAFGINGFMTLPLEQSTLPSDDNTKEVLPKSMNDMLRYMECHNALKVASERYLNYWNSNYYVGIWGTPMNIAPNLVAFPREWFSDLKESDAETWLREQYDLPAADRLVTRAEELSAKLQEQAEKAATRERELRQQMEQLSQIAADHERELQQAADDLRGQLTDSQAYCAYVKEQAAHDAHVGKLEQERISMFLELTTKEKETLSTSLWETRGELEKTQHELERTQCALERAQRELELIKSSRGFKLLNVGFPIKRRIWKLFGKEI